MTLAWVAPATVVRLHRRALGRGDAGARAAAAAAFHQAGCACHRELLEHEILHAFDARRAPDDPPNAVLEAAGDVDLAARAQHRYDIALALAPGFAEARYNRASLDRRTGRRDAAFAGYQAVLGMAPHPRAQPHAFLHANAAWEAAKLAEVLQPARAAALFAQAVAGLDNFGVEHRRYADHLDRTGRPADALREYDRLTRYAHRYPPEVLIPDVDSDTALPTGPDGRPLDPLVPSVVATADGAAAVYFLHLYFRVARDVPDLATTLVDALDRGWVARLTRRGPLLIEACAPRLADLPGFARR